MKKKQPIIRYQNLAIIQLGLIIFDFVMDILFASKKAREVEWLYIPNTIILALSLTINFTLALYIIYNERSKFKKWSNAMKFVSIFFTLLASTDIGALNILQSKMANLDFLKAEFSEAARKKIFWGACLDIFVEDLPQVIIQIIYIRTVVYHDIIPLLSLVSSCLTLTVHTIGRLYQVVQCDKKVVPGSTDNFGDKGGSPPAKKAQIQKTPHPLQFIPEHDNNREVEVKSLVDKEKIRGKGGKVLPDVIVDSQVDLNDIVSDQTKLNKRSSFQELIEQV